MLETTTLKGAAARRDQNRQQMRHAILDAAQDIIDAEGMDGLTIRAVAKQLGYSPGALYEYFPSKEHILATLHHVGRNGLTAFCLQMVGQLGEDATSEQIIIGLGRAYREFALANQETFRLVNSYYKQAPANCVELYEEDRSAFHMLVSVVERGIAEKYFLDLPPVVIATSLWIAVHGFAVLEINGEFTRAFDEFDQSIASMRLDELYEQMMRLTLRGVMRNPEPGPS